MGSTQGTVSLCLLPSSDSDFALSINVDGLDYVLDCRNNDERVSCISVSPQKLPPDYGISASTSTRIRM